MGAHCLSPEPLASSPDPLPKPSGTSNSWQPLLLLAGRREVCLSPEPPASSPDLLLRLNGTSSSWPPLLPPLPCSTLAQAFLFQALSPAWSLDPLPKPSGTSNSWQLLLLLAGRREVCLSLERSPASSPAPRPRLDGMLLN